MFTWAFVALLSVSLSVSVRCGMCVYSWLSFGLSFLYVSFKYVTSLLDFWSEVSASWAWEKQSSSMGSELWAPILEVVHNGMGLRRFRSRAESRGP